MPGDAIIPVSVNDTPPTSKFELAPSVIFPVKLDVPVDVSIVPPFNVTASALV
jgi:hypothetical protein